MLKYIYNNVCVDANYLLRDNYSPNHVSSGTLPKFVEKRDLHFKFYFRTEYLMDIEL